MRDLIIIGGGPAACTAGIYAGRKKLDTLLVAKDFTGQLGLSSWVENYPGFRRISGIELGKKFVKQVRQYDIDIKAFEEVLNVKRENGSFLVTTDEGEYKGGSVIIATGAMPKRLGIENEEKFIGKGVSYCVTCDALGFENKKVAVIGGGNAGVEAALELTRFAKRVYLFEILDKLTADNLLVEKVSENDKIEVVTSATVEAFKGDRELEKIVYVGKGSNEKKSVSVDGCFIEIGTLPNTDFLKGFVELNKKGEIIVNPKTFETSVKGVYAAGDVVDFEDKQVVIATGQGALAVLSVCRYLKSLDKECL
jgi:NADH-dependent peroxiredoxin subunit F